MATVHTRAEPRLWQYPSFFWPPVFVCIGAVILFWNLDVVTPASMTVFARLWPLLLIGAGLDVLLGRRSPAFSAAIGAGLAVLALLLAFAGPSFGLAGSIKTYSFSEPVGKASSAQIQLHVRAGHVHVQGDAASGQLIGAELTDTSVPDFAVSGTGKKVVVVGRAEENTSSDFYDQLSRRAIAHLSRAVPLGVDLQIGSGIANLDLRRIQLTSLFVNSGSGRADVDLPATPSRYAVQMNSGSGALQTRIPDGAALDLTATLGSGRINLDIGQASDLNAQITDGSGNLTLHIPEMAAVRIEVSSDTGSLSLPSRLVRIGSPADSGNSGVWESPHFDQASHRITLTVQLGSGSIQVS
jgi:putative adhesin